MSIVSIFYGLFFGLWIVAFISTLTSSFKNEINKLIWILVLIFIPISAIVYFFISPKQIHNNETENVESKEVAKALILKTNNKSKANKIIESLKEYNGEITEKIFRTFVDSDTKLSHRASDGYYSIDLWAPEISSVIQKLTNKELYLEPVPFRFNNEVFYFIIFLIDKKSIIK